MLNGIPEMVMLLLACVQVPSGIGVVVVLLIVTPESLSVNNFPAESAYTNLVEELLRVSNLTPLVVCNCSEGFVTPIPTF